MQVAPRRPVETTPGPSRRKKWKHWIQPEALSGNVSSRTLRQSPPTRRECSIGHLGHGFKVPSNDAHALSDHRLIRVGLPGAASSLRLPLGLLRKTLEPRSRNRHRMGLHRYDTFECKGCGRSVPTKAHNHVSPAGRPQPRLCILTANRQPPYHESM